MLTKPMCQLSLTEKQLSKNLYLCVRVDGENVEGHPLYAYFGIFLDDFLSMIQQLQTRSSMNPKDVKAIVLARSTGERSDHIAQFMRMKFSFVDENSGDDPILEISKG